MSSKGIPPASRKIVASLKEIVNFPEAEIYAVLKECNMDPSEAVNRLLAQDTFQEVKSKRDKKKEVKDTSESKARGISSTNSRGGRAGHDRAVRAVSNSSTSNDYGATHSKSVPKKENTRNTIPESSILGSSVSGNVTYRPSGVSPASMDTHISSSTEGIPSFSRSSTGSAWSGAPGQVSMADIVRMGRPHTKVSSKPPTVSETPDTFHNVANSFQYPMKHAVSTIPPPESVEWHSSEDHFPKVSETNHDPDVADVDQHISLDERSSANHFPSEQRSSMFLTSTTSPTFIDSSTSSRTYNGGVDFNLDSHVDENHATHVNVNSRIGLTDSSRSDTPSDGQRHPTEFGGRSIVEGASFNNLSPYETQTHIFERQEVEGINSEVPSVAAQLQQLSIRKDETSDLDDRPAVIFPNHLQVTNADCSHLSFGSFGSGLGAKLPGQPVQTNQRSEMELPSSTSEVSSFDRVDARNPEFYSDEHAKSTLDEDLIPRSSTSTENYEQSASSQSAVAEPKTNRPIHELHYDISSVMPGHEFASSTQCSDPERSYPDARVHSQNVVVLPNPMNYLEQGYADSLHNNVLSSAAQPTQDFDPPYLPRHSTESLATKYSTMLSSITEPTVSTSETVNPSFFSVPQPTSQPSESTNLPSGPFPQHLPVHPYQQQALPIGHFANMIGYPFLPTYPYLPTAAFQQPFTGNSAYHQSPAVTQTAGAKYSLPQYKSNVSLSSLQQSGSIPSGYGNFGSSANIPGNFLLNTPSAPTNIPAGFEDALSSQYKEGSTYGSLQQGGGSRTALPHSYYNLQGQSQHGGFRQSQSPPQQQQPSPYGALGLGYPNFYRSQLGVPQEHLPNPNDVANLSSSQGLPSQASHQLWQRNF